MFYDCWITWKKASAFMICKKLCRRTAGEMNKAMPAVSVLLPSSFSHLPVKHRKLEKEMWPCFAFSKALVRVETARRSPCCFCSYLNDCVWAVFASGARDIYPVQAGKWHSWCLQLFFPGRLVLSLKVKGRTSRKNDVPFPLKVLKQQEK